MPPEDGSVQPQTLEKRVSDDPDISFFDAKKQRMTKDFDKNFHQQDIRQKIHKLPVLEEIWLSGDAP